MRSPDCRTTISRLTDSRRARNSASVRIGALRRPASRPSRRRCFFASRRVEPRREPTSSAPLAERLFERGSRTLTTVFGGSSGEGSRSSLPRLRRRLRRRPAASSPSSSPDSASSPAPSAPSSDSSSPDSDSSPRRRLRPRPPLRRLRRLPSSSVSSPVLSSGPSEAFPSPDCSSVGSSPEP